MDSILFLVLLVEVKEYLGAANFPWKTKRALAIPSRQSRSYLEESHGDQ